MYKEYAKNKRDQGYTLLLSVLISSIILAMSLGIFAIAYKEVVLATFARDSARANAAASRALECAVFLDRINSHAAQDHGMGPTTYNSRTQNYYTPFQRGDTTINTDYANNYNEAEKWPVVAGVPAGATWALECSGVAFRAGTYMTGATGATSGTSTISYSFSDACADVEVDKSGIDTTFISNGYSDCNVNNSRRTMRVIQVTMNI